MTNHATVIRQDATGNILSFLQPNENYVDDGQIAIRIEREIDGYVFDISAPNASDHIFKPDASCINPFLPLVSGTGNNSGRLQASITIDSNFVDGGYLINYHDFRFPAHRVFAIDKVGVWNGSAYMVKPITSSDAVITSINNIQTAIAAVQTTVTQNQTDVMTVQATVSQNQTAIAEVQTLLVGIQTSVEPPCSIQILTN